VRGNAGIARPTLSGAGRGRCRPPGLVAGPGRAGEVVHRHVAACQTGAPAVEGPAAMTTSLEIRLLGPFEALVGGRRAEVTGPKRHALLALLALGGGRMVPVEVLVDALWGAEVPAAPRNAVQHHVSRLRAALGADAIAAAADGYALASASVDALRFEELLAMVRSAQRAGDAGLAAKLVARALALWHGRPLQSLPDSPWVSAEAARLEALRIDALEEQFEAALALGEHTDVVGRVRRVLEEHPFRERLWGQLMLAQYRSGRQAEALESFRQARQLLAEQLGVEPGAEVQRLQAAILAHDPALASVPAAVAPRGRLPAPVNSFVGRQQALAEAAELVGKHRLVSLIGAPGVGKSRLALELARAVEHDFAGGVWFVELARAARPADVARVAARTLDARGPTRSRDPLAWVVERLRRANVLLVLDGCEHVMEEAARVAADVLAGCPGVRVLTTSREVLHLEGEVRVVVAPLAVPATGADAREVAASESVRLFLERARASRPGLPLTEDGLALAAEICRRLDGLPLAIELAAARVSVLGLREILSALESRRPLFVEARDRRAVPQRYLRTVVAWSHDLLHTDERALLHQLAVFRGGVPLSAVLATAARSQIDAARATQLLGAMVDKSILTASFPDGGARYDLLDTVREYAVEQLAKAGSLGDAQLVHAEYFATVADAARAELRGPDWLACTRRLELEHDNLWAAMAYARDAADPAIGVRLGAGLGWYFALAERVSEGRSFLEAARASASADTPVSKHTELLAFLCYLATEELDLDAAIDVGERALAVAGTGPAPSESALARVALSLALALFGDDVRAAALAEEARAGYRRAGDHWGVAASSLVRAQGAVRLGEVSTVATMAAELLRHSDAIGYSAFKVPAMLLEAWVAERRNEAGTAEDAYRRALALARRIGFDDHVSFALAQLGSNALAHGDTHPAEELCRRALTMAEAATTSWLAAHARVQLARVQETAGDADSAETLYRRVVEWSQTPRPRQVRESLFVGLAGSPGAAALRGLARLAAARGHDDAAEDLQARAAVIAERDRGAGRRSSSTRP
jgi:predicted ATPase/DNA-binding SARP family transcriptional activator